MLKDANGQQVLSFQPPAPGYAVLMQGSAIEHSAPASSHERVTMVIAYVPRETHLFDRDKTNLRIASTYDDRESLCRDFFEYRLQAMKHRCAELRGAAVTGSLNTELLCSELDRLADYLHHSRQVLADARN